MNNQIRNRTWKYFLEQKLKELSITIGSVAGFIFIPFWLGNLFFYIIKEEVEEFVLIWFAGLFLTAVLALILCGIIYWIDCNWEKALKKAKKDFKKKNE